MSRNFDGVDDKVDYGNILAFERTDTFSFSIWYKPGTSSPTVNYCIFSKEQGSGNFTGYALLVLGATAGDPYRINLTSVPGNGIQANYTRTNDTNWHHLVMTYSGNSALSGVNLYEDSVLLTPTSFLDFLTTSIVTTTTLQIANRDANNNPGLMKASCMEVFNRVLSLNEINQIRIFPGSIKNGQVLFSPLWGGSPEADYSSNGRVGTVTGATVSADNPPINGISLIPSPQTIQVF